MTMTRTLSCLVIVTLLSGTTAMHGQAPPAPAPRPAASGARLPVRKVVLYKSGVGYFEHRGRVSGSQAVTLELTSGQLNDMLMSLTAVDLSGGQVAGVTYNTAAPLTQMLSALSLPLSADVTRAQLLEALRGSRVDVSGSGAAASGRIVGVAEKTLGTDEHERKVHELTIVGDAGDVRAFDLVPGLTVTLAEGELRRDVGRYLDALATTREADVRRLQIATRGTGDRELFVSYVAAVPVWKTSYRLVVPDGSRKPFLQGWAIVDNTLGEDWTDVQLSLVAGAPQSFVQPLSQPIFTNRPIVEVQTGTVVAPEVHAPAMSTPQPSAPSPPASVMMNAPESRLARGSLGGVVGGLPEAPPPPPPPAPAFRSAIGAEDAMASVEAAAQGASLGELFEYKLTQPVTVRRNQSAMVPVVQHDVTIERISLWSARRGVPQPLRALWLTNDTGLTLDGGSVTLVEGNAFAGAGLVDTIKPGEKRFVSYAMDLGVRVTASPQTGTERVSRVRIASGTITTSTENRSAMLYTVRNDDTTAREVVIEHPVRAGWSLTGTAKPVESTETAHRFRLTAAPGATATLTVAEVRPIDSRVGVTTLSDDQITLILRGRNVAAGIEPQLRAIAAKSREVAQAQRANTDRQAEVRRIGEDQTRVRENLKALKGSEAEKALVERYTRQLGTQEDRLEVLRKEIEAGEADRAAKQAELVKLVAALSLDVELP
jgi:hypothetical protein